MAPESIQAAQQQLEATPNWVRTRNQAMAVRLSVFDAFKAEFIGRGISEGEAHQTALALTQAYFAGGE